MQHTDFVSTLFDQANDPNKVTVAFTLGVKALEHGHSATIILMVDAVHLGIKGATDGLDIGTPFMPVSTLLESFLQQGGQIAVCKACMVHNHVDEQALDPRMVVISADDVLSLLMQAKGGLQLT